MFRNIFLSINLLMGFLVFIVMSATFILPFFLQNVKGYPTQLVGFFMMSTPIVMGLVAPLAGSLSDKLGSRVISLAGLVVFVLACLGLTTIRQDTSALGIVLRLAPLGLGLGLFQSPNNSAIMGAVPRERLGVTSGFIGLARTLGSTSGLPLMGSLFAAQVLASGLAPGVQDVTQAPPGALVAGVNGTFQAAAFVVVASTLLAATALFLDQRRKRAAARVIAGGSGSPPGRT